MGAATIDVDRGLHPFSRGIPWNAASSSFARGANAGKFPSAARNEEKVSKHVCRKQWRDITIDEMAFPEFISRGKFPIGSLVSESRNQGKAAGLRVFRYVELPNRPGQSP